MKMKCFILVAFAISLAVLFAASDRILPQDERGVTVRFRGDHGELKNERLYTESFALVIGVCEYTSGLRRLRGPEGEIIDIKRCLEGHGFKVIALKNPDSASLKSGIDSFIL